MKARKQVPINSAIKYVICIHSARPFSLWEKDRMRGSKQGIAFVIDTPLPQGEGINTILLIVEVKTIHRMPRHKPSEFEIVWK